MILCAGGEVAGVVADSVLEFWAGLEQDVARNKSSKQAIVVYLDRLIFLRVILVVNLK